MLTKTISYDPQTRDYRMELDGLLVGYAACYHEAERVLNETAYEWLTHGYTATATALDGAQADDDPFGDPRSDEEKRASVDGWIEFGPCEGYPFGGWEKPHTHPFDKTRTVMERKPRLFAAAQADDEPEPEPVNWTDRDPDAKPEGDVPSPYMRMPEGDILDADGMRVSLAEIGARLSVCPNCGGDHSIQLCPEVRAALFAPEASWKDVALGRELCRMRWKNYSAFTALIRSVPRPCLVDYAESYIAFIRSYRPDSDVGVADVLGAWTRMCRAQQAVA